MGSKRTSMEDQLVGAFIRSEWIKRDNKSDILRREFRSCAKWAVLLGGPILFGMAIMCWLAS
jgi:hypothetical protein